MKSILFIVPSMRGGGAERVMLNLLKYLPRDQFDLSLALVEKVGPYLKEIPADVPVYDMQAYRVRYAIPRLVNLINRQRPDVVFSTLGHLNIALLMVRRLLPNNTKFIIREASIVSKQIINTKSKRLWTLMYRIYYPKADILICQSEYMLNDLIYMVNISHNNLQVIYNPVDLDLIRKKAIDINPFKRDSNYNVIAVGRLDKAKAFHRTIQAFPLLLYKKPEANLWILGDGPLRTELQELSRNLHIEDRVNFVGFQENPYAWMAHADLFVLSSSYEGLPNVMLEAIACGCPVISLQHPGGTREIMELTGQLERYVPELTWEDWWFDSPSPDVKQKLDEHFGSESAIKHYTKILRMV